MAQDIIDKVRESIESRDQVIKSLYLDTSYRKAVIGTLVNKGCDPKEAEDRFTDAIISFIKACYRPDFEIKSSLTNYLIGAAKNIWLKRVTKTMRERTTEYSNPSETESSIEDELIKTERKTLLQQVINSLDPICKKVLTLWAINKKMKAIATALGYKSEGMARKKKHQCLQRLYAIVDEHPSIKQDLSNMI